MTVSLDHILWAAPDLDAGIAHFAAVTGATPVVGGTHPGFGTRNALLSLSPTTYIEVIAPDPSQDLAGTLGGEIAALAQPRLWTFALATDDLSAAAKGARAAGIDVLDPIAMSRTTPEGARLDWTVLRIADDRWPGKLPFFIDWKGSPHPASTTPGGATLDTFTAIDPDAPALSKIYEAIGCPVEVRGGTTSGFIAYLTTPNGSVVLT